LSFACKYCNKTYSKESTLTAHLCEPKRRHQQQNETGVQLGFKAYLRFYEITQGSAKLKTYDDFVASSYYSAFVKFGRHLVAIRAVNTSSFTDWLLKNNKKLDHWCKDVLYLEWLQAYLRKELVQDAMERALKEMQDYADNHTELINNFNDYFRNGNGNRICHHISNGRISPWIVYNCDSGVEFLGQLNEEQVEIIMPWIDPDVWNQRFKDYAADTEWIKDILAKAGL
jgi:uncharacterized protein YeeX (DUF496 family)